MTGWSRTDMARKDTYLVILVTYVEETLAIARIVRSRVRRKLAKAKLVHRRRRMLIGRAVLDRRRRVRELLERMTMRGEP